jgi:DNA-binding NarL/FixJ family response regulator
MINILIADDHPVVRKGMKQIIEEATDMKITDEASNGAEVLSKISKNDFDIILLDITMPGRSGLEILKEAKKIKPKIPIIVLSIHPEQQYAIRALKAGASGYLTKSSAPEELITAVRIVSEGRKYISPSLAELLASDLIADKEKLPHETLSNREYQIMCLLCSGKRLTDISEELCLSVKTISTYRTRILKKMNMKTNAELTYYAFQNRLVY